jgi:excinuclease UvrABC nuclease subunit
MQDINNNIIIDSIIQGLDKSKNKEHVSTKSELSNMWVAYLFQSPENQVEKAFTKGTKLIHNLLLESKIDADTAGDILAQFVNIYVEHKIEMSIHKFLKKHDNRPFVNALGTYLRGE